MVDETQNTNAPTEEQSERTRPRPQLQTREQVAAGEAAAQATKISDVLDPEPEIVILRGREFRLAALTMSDFLRIEQDHGSVETLFQQISAEKLAALRYLLWLTLRKTEPSLTEEQAGDLIEMQAGQVGAVVMKIMLASGLFPEGAGKKGESPA